MTRPVRSRRSCETAALSRSPTAIAFAARVGAYVRAVVDDEWPRMHQGKDSTRASAAVDGIYTAIQEVDPRSPKAVAFYDDSVNS